MKKNILIVGAARSGKTSLAKKIAKEKGYSLISIDDLVSGLEVYPDLEIHHDGDASIAAKNLAPFLIKFLTELSEGNTFYDGIYSVIEGTHIDFEQIMPFLRSEKYRDKYKIIGLTYNHISANQLYENMKKYDTEDDWTYWCNDEELLGNARYFIERNIYFNEKFSFYNIESYDTSFDRENVFDTIVNDL